MLCLARPLEVEGLAIELRGGVPFVEFAESPRQSLLLERSTGLASWEEIARVQERLWAYGDWAAVGKPQAFYRISQRPLTSIDDWSNQLSPSNDALFTPGTGSGLAATRFAKFSILLDGTDRVYFQDSVKWPFHYSFARARLPGYATMTVLEFNAQGSMRMRVSEWPSAPS